MEKPLVTVVIAVKHGEAFLGEAIESARAQTWPATEIIVVDGHSNDRSREIALSYPGIRVLLQEGKGRIVKAALERRRAAARSRCDS